MRNQRTFSRLRDLLAFTLLLGCTVSLAVEVLDVPAAHAKKKKKSKKSSKKKAAPAPVEQAAEASPASNEIEEKELRTSGPAALEVPFSSKEFDNTAKADKKRDEAIEEIRVLIPKVNGDQ
ncbi:MAG: hypothetical protein ACO3JL_16585, partial [Myxococcota bacterium]